MKFRSLLALLPAFLLISPSLWAQKYTPADSLRGSYHALRSNNDLRSYHLQIRVLPETHFLKGSNTLRFLALENLKQLQIDLDPAFDILTIDCGDLQARWERIGTSVKVTLPKWVNKGQRFALRVEYQGHPRVASHAPWDGGFVWAKDQAGMPWIGLACEGEGASLWFPSKDHPADEPDSCWLDYEVPKGLVAVGNGQFLKKENASDSTWRYRYQVSYPINHYNVSFNAAAYKTWSENLPGTDLRMDFFCLQEDEEKARRQWKQSEKVLTTLGELFGPYPFVRDGYKLVQTPFLGMEHQSCIAYGDKFEDNALGFDFILMHETGHEWWGNLVSGSDHADMWIHESFCTYSEALYVEKTQNYEAALRWLGIQKKKIKHKSHIQGARDVFFNDWKDSDMYYKGSWMLHSLRYQINNDARWFRALRQLPDSCAWKPLNTEAILNRFGKLLGQPVSAFCQPYLFQTQIPVLEYRKKSETNTWEFRWTQVPADFKADAPVLLEGKTNRVSAGTEWKDSGLAAQTGPISADERLMLFDLKPGR
jgi:aminopeptidase N